MAKVLIAEPSADVRALLERSIVRLGHEAVTLDRSRAIEGGEADVLLLEPAFNGGVELAQLMRSSQPELAIVICSIYPPSPELSELSPVAHLLKPFQRDALEHALTAAVAATS
jgi:two-component SAPR family response regulator